MKYLFQTGGLLLSVVLLFFLSTEETVKKISSSRRSFNKSYLSHPIASVDSVQYKDAPDFTLPTMEGNRFTLSEHEGKIVVINIWATWCPPCREEIPDLIEVQNELRDKDVLMVGVSMDKKGWQVVRPFAKKMNINYPIVLDDGTVFEGFGPYRGIPTTFIINKKGQVENVAIGMIPKKQLTAVLKQMIAR